MPDVMQRYEPNISGGLFFLYKASNKTFWMGNESSFRILKLFNGKKNMRSIYELIKPYFCEFDFNDLKSNLNDILEELIDKEFIMIGNNIE